MSINLFLLGLQLNGFPIRSAMEEYEHLKNMVYKTFVINQDKTRWNIFKHHYLDNKEYRSWIINNYGKEPKSWNEIPILTKTDLQKPVAERLTNGYTLKNVHLHNTSGSSGHPFYFAKDKFSHAMTWAAIFDMYRKHDLEYGKSRQARFYGIPLSKSKYYKEKIKDFLATRVRFTVFDMSDKILTEYVEQFKKYPFNYINGYTSSLVLFAKYLTKNNLILKTVCPSLKLVIPTSEVLNEIDRAWLKQGFGVPVVNEYGAAELDIIAFEDQDFDWILNNQNLLIEIVDEKNQPLPNGEEGRIIITSLYNKAMPFIRYELGDIGSVAPLRKGNNQILKTLQGRTNDIAILPSGKKSPGLTFYYISKSLLETGGGMKEFIIKQTAIDNFVFEYTSDSELTAAQKQKVNDAMAIYLESGLHADFVKKDKIDRMMSGKLKHFQYLVK